MARRFNYTGRKKIKREHVTIRLKRDDGVLAFDADLTRLAGLGLDSLDPPPNVYVEAYRGASALWKRFDFGRINTLQPPDDRSLDEFGDEHGIRFRVKVSAVGGESHGRLVAEADNLPPLMPGQADEQGRPLIECAPGDGMGHELWRVDFEDEPQVLVNPDVPGGWKDFARDVRFRTLFAPAVMREVLTRILIIDRDSGDAEDESDWRANWCRFAGGLLGREPKDVFRIEPDNTGRLANLTELQQAIDDAVATFAERGDLLSVFSRATEGGGITP